MNQADKMIASKLVSNSDILHNLLSRLDCVFNH